MGSFSLTHWLILGGIVWLIWRMLRKGKPAPTQSTPPPNKPSTHRPTAAPALAWPGLGTFECEVAGESHYQDWLRQLAGSHGVDSANKHVTAHLIPEDNNPHDSDAVRVEVDGRPVGYLPRGDATTFRERLDDKRLGLAVTTCAALIVGGYVDRSGERKSYGVQLDIEPLE